MGETIPKCKEMGWLKSLEVRISKGCDCILVGYECERSESQLRHRREPETKALNSGKFKDRRMSIILTAEKIAPIMLYGFTRRNL